MRLIQNSFILALAFSINSCGLATTVYQNAPEVVGWWLDDYLDLTSTQEAALNPALDRLHQWHRQQELPQYVSLIQEIQSIAAKEKITPTEVCAKVETIKSSVTDLQLAFVPTILEIAPTLSDKQMAYLKTKLEKRAEKWKSEWWQETSEDQIEARLDKIEDYAESFYGDLSTAQLEMIEQQLAQSPIQPEMTYQEVLRRNADIVQILTSLHDKNLSTSQQTQLISEGFKRLHKSPNQSYQAYLALVNQRTCEIVSTLHASTTAKQKQHAKGWFEKHSKLLSTWSMAKT
ncbi:MAG: hypothetical protein B7X95_07705 [Methylophilaceae bacterium 17-44-8]|nr:MAG: hypothetical protein B7Y48_05370 [Methylophilales bacterium 28-44-11]OZA05129.1 MAG: hypothetical protein B7X95_07705 [Methylophilaceae bacterium 17-44-8]